MVLGLSWLSQRDQIPMKFISQKLFEKYREEGSGRGEGVYIWGEIKSSFTDPILCILIDGTQSFMHSKSQILKFFIIALCWNTQPLIIITLPSLKVLIHIWFFFTLLPSFSPLIAWLVYITSCCTGPCQRRSSHHNTDEWASQQVDEIHWPGMVATPIVMLFPPSVSFLICWE